MRLIDADVVFPWYVNTFKDIEPSDVRFSMNDIKGNLDNIQPIEIPQWIPLSERLPEDGTWNLFVDSKGRTSVERYKADAIDHFWPESRWFELEEAVAWMPLPEPYKEEMESEENGN